MMAGVAIGVTGCKNASDAGFCRPAFTSAVDRLASEALAADIPDSLGNAVADVVTGHDAGCAK